MLMNKRKKFANMTLGQRVCSLRKDKSISQGQLAKALGVTRQAVSKWENDLSVPDTAKLIQIADLLETDLEYLTFGRVVVPSRPPVVITSENRDEKAVVQIIEKVVEHKVEVPVEVPVYIKTPVVKRVLKVKYVRNPIEFVIIGAITFILGVLIGILI